MIIIKLKNIMFLALFTFVFIQVKAQSDFRPGYIITIKGDSLKGFVDYRNEPKNSEECIFKKELKSDKVIYKPNQLKSYGFLDGKYYISNNTQNFKSVPNIFLEYVSKGPISIFYYRDKTQGHYIASKDTLTVELNHLVKNSDSNTNSTLTKSNRYKDQLKYLMRDQSIIFEKIDAISCDREDLIYITKEYQKLCCPSQEYIQYEINTSKSTKIKFGLFTSIGNSNFKSPPYNLNKSNYEPTIFLEFDTSVTYEIGAMLNLYLNFIAENRTIFQFTPSLNFAKYSSLTEKNVSPLVNTFKTDIELTTLKIPLIFKYSFYNSTSLFIPNLRFGFGNTIFIKQEGTHEYRSRLINNQNQPEVVNRNEIDFGTTSDTYLIIGTGLDIKLGKKLLMIGLTYENATKMLESTRSDVQLQLGYQF